MRMLAFSWAYFYLIIGRSPRSTCSEAEWRSRTAYCQARLFIVKRRAPRAWKRFAFSGSIFLALSLLAGVYFCLIIGRSPRSTCSDTEGVPCKRNGDHARLIAVALDQILHKINIYSHKCKK